MPPGGANREVLESADQTLTGYLDIPNLHFMYIATIKSRATEVADLMKMLSNPHRLMILCELLEGERSVGLLQKAVGIGQSSLSQHLAKLRHHGLVTVRREAQTIHYSLADPNVREVISLLYRLYCEPFPDNQTIKETTEVN